MTTPSTAGTIAAPDVMPLLLERCPSFAPGWERFSTEWSDDPAGPPLYLAMAELGRHLVTLVERDETACLPPLFAAVEQVLAQGDDEARDLVAVGLVEDLANNNLYTDEQRERMYAYLGERARGRWRHVDAFWGSDAPMRAGDWITVAAIVGVLTALILWAL